MKKFVALLAVVLLASSTCIVLAKVNPNLPSFLHVTQAPTIGDLEEDIPVRDQSPARADTVVFGYYSIKPDGLKYAVLGGEWTFDHAAADPLEGWTSADQTLNDQVYWRQLTESKWIAEGGPTSPVSWPSITGDGMVLCGATKGHADSLGWVNGIGYGNRWCQRLTSPTLTYGGAGSVDLSLKYFSESELGYDYTRIFVESGTSRVMVNSPGFTGQIGVDLAVSSVPEAKAVPPGVLSPVSYQRSISNLELGGGAGPRLFQVVIEFSSDSWTSDEDGPEGFDSFYGGIGMDDIRLEGTNLVPPATVSFGFEAGLEGWTATRCPGVGAFMGVANLSQYVIEDPCGCAIAGNVLEMHDDSYLHPDGQHEMLYTPILDRENDIPGGAYLAYDRILAEWDQYSDLPQANGVFYRPGWTYYPYESPGVPGMIGWSPRVGQATAYYSGDTPACFGPETGLGRSVGTDWGLPADAKRVRFIYEIFASCEEFGVDPCSGVTNFTPIIDNITVRNVDYVNAPVALFEPGTRFQDGYGQSPAGLVSTVDPGNADIIYDLRRSTGQPTRLGDSLMVAGPMPLAATKWEAKLWFRLKRMGPGQNSPLNPGLAAFNQWKTVVRNNKGDFYTGDQPGFAWGYMDSVEVSTVRKNQFCSQFRESAPGGGLTPEPCFNWGGGTGDQGEGNEILPDGVFTPGTKIEYFITTNYVTTPTAYYFYPDTTGRAYREFEILPSFRTVGGVDKFPCVLYVDAFNGGTQRYIENALNVVLNGAGSGVAIPDPTTWDRYDYLDASSSWNGPLYRMAGGNGGATMYQLLGYKLILVTTGTRGIGTMEPRDWQGIQTWLEAISCGGNTRLQGFIADGTAIAQIIDDDCPALLNSALGTSYTCATYSELGCPPGETPAQNDQNYCVRVEPAAGSPFGAGVASDVFGNWCPTTSFNVINTTGTGFGSKVYEKINRTDDHQTRYAQVINDKIGAAGFNYRSVVQSCGYERLIARDMDNQGLNECRYLTVEEQTAARMAAVSKEIENAVKWTLNISDPHTQVGMCHNPCTAWEAPGERPVNENATGAAVTRLYENHPNPFNPRTAIKFSLAADGAARLVVYDVNGRRIRTLVDRRLHAGTHEVVWDGTDDAGHPVTSGVFWSQLQAGSYCSNRKMVVLK